MSFLRQLKINTFQFGNLALCPNCLDEIRKYKYKKQVIKSKFPSFLYFGESKSIQSYWTENSIQFVYRFPWSSFLSIEIECTYEAAQWAKSEKSAI